MYTSTPPHLPDPLFRFFQGLVPRLVGGGGCKPNQMAEHTNYYNILTSGENCLTSLYYLKCCIVTTIHEKQAEVQLGKGVNKEYRNNFSLTGNENTLNFTNHGTDTTVQQGSPATAICFCYRSYEHFVGVLDSCPTARRSTASRLL